MSKCDACKNNITKTSPGLECSKCERIVHLNNKCTGLTNKQITALKAAPSLEWTCQQCQQESPRRYASIIIPEEEEEDDESPVQINANKFLKNITKEVEKTIKSELRELNDSLQFHSAKLDEVVECIDAFKKTIKNLERKNIELTNKNNNLEIRLGALEQRLQELEQEKLAKFIEIANVPYQKNEEIKEIVEKVAIKLKVPKEGIKSVRRLQGRNDQIIKVELEDESTQEKWIIAAKGTKTTVSDINPTDKGNNNIVYIREAMTKLNKKIFWNAKQELKINQNFKFVWFKKGYVRARKDENEKTYTLKTMDDLYTIINKKA
ncbi:uncharacterized protein LOC124539422 [Vanessa cardui]|uniref:uncharacterized protein LOC124539422 n=1 Tax=Vanessa cardui TaxID=171605 RepID=UPI001F1463CA|nr:uncharacterized protein LOC124539422 [Vanessa cardui]